MNLIFIIGIIAVAMLMAIMLMIYNVELNETFEVMDVSIPSSFDLLREIHKPDTYTDETINKMIDDISNKIYEMRQEYEKTILQLEHNIDKNKIEILSLNDKILNEQKQNEIKTNEIKQRHDLLIQQLDVNKKLNDDIRFINDKLLKMEELYTQCNSRVKILDTDLSQMKIDEIDKFEYRNNVKIL